MLRIAREHGFDVSGEVCPHHFTLTSDDMILGDTNYKMNPPLRTEEDRQALLEGLKDGTFEVISTDHAPHSTEEKSTTMRKAPFGIVGAGDSRAPDGDGAGGGRDSHSSADGGEDEPESGKDSEPFRQGDSG